MFKVGEMYNVKCLENDTMKIAKCTKVGYKTVSFCIDGVVRRLQLRKGSIFHKGITKMYTVRSVDVIEGISNGDSVSLSNSSLDVKSEPTEEDIKSSLIADLVSDKDNYRNEDKTCICSKCEIKGMCNYANKFQRLEREQGGLGLCHKLNDFTFYNFVENHLEKYKLIVDTRRKKRDYIEVELLPILQKFDDKIVATSYKIYYHEEYLNIRYTDKSVKLYITATNLEGIKKLVRKEILKPKLLKAWKSVRDGFSAMQDFYDIYYCYGKRESEYRELYSMAIDEYDDTIELLKLYNDKFYDYVTELRTRGNTYETCIYNALYCIKSGRIPDEDRR
ncbi:MAG: hypothetical protein ACI4WH_07615 [Oscillospiraceae bacterium]